MKPKWIAAVLAGLSLGWLTAFATDTTPPSIPGGLAASAVTVNSFTLNWAASTDNVGVTGYEVFKGGVSLGTVAGTTLPVGGLVPNTTYSMQVRARDAAGNWSAKSTTLSVRTLADTTAPSVPDGLAAPAPGLTSFTLNWNPATDNVAVTGYQVYKNGVSVGTPTTPSIAITGLVPNTPYLMTVRARDAAANWSVQSAGLTVTTPPDVAPPTVPGGLAASTLSVTSFTLTWATSSDDVKVTAYEVFKNGASLGTVTTPTKAVTGLTPNTVHTMTVRARDAAGNWSGLSAALPVTTLPDVTPPTVPVNLTATAVTVKSFILGWTASTDDVKVTTYEVFKDGVSLGSSTSRPRTLSGLIPGTTYVMTVRAADAAGNWSAQSAPLAITTLPDITAPTAPVTLTSSSVSAKSFTLSWTTATDDMGVTGYEVYRDGVLQGTTTTARTLSVTGLAPHTAYAMTVRARDATGNWSALSTALTVTTLTDVTAPSVPGGLAGTAISAGSFTLTWTNSTDNVAVTGYEVFRNGVSLGLTATNSLAVTGLTPHTAYAMTVRATDASGNWSALSTAKSVTTSNDTTAPSVPTGLVASALTATGFTLNWTASTDNVGVTAYEVFKNGVSQGTTVTLAMNLTGLNLITNTYAMTVRARDAVGNWSVQSGALNVSKQSDTTPPSIPTGLVSSNVTATGLTISWSAASDNFGVTLYEVFVDGVSRGTTSGTSMNLTGLSAGTSYTLTVRAQDAAGNWSNVSAGLVVGYSGVPFIANFEPAEGYAVGPLTGQNGWNVTGSATIVTSPVYAGVQAVSIPPNATASFTTHGFSGTNPVVTYIDFFALPAAAATPDAGVFFETDVAMVSLTGSGVIQGFDGNGTGGGTWTSAGTGPALDGSGQAAAWARFTLRCDYAAKKWDLYLDGRMILADLGFLNNTSTSLAALTLGGHSTAAVGFDELFVSYDNPLFEDADNNGLSDAWEMANFGHLGVNPQADSDQDGLKNWMEFRLGTNPNNPDTDGDGISDGQEFVAGTNPLVPEAPAVLSGIPGLRLLLRADAGVTADGDGNVSAWVDQSGRGMNATQPSSTAQPARVLNALNGHPVVRFSGDSYQSLGLPDVMNGATAGEIFAVVRSAETAPTTYRTLWSFGSNPSGTMYPNFGGIVYEGFGSTDWTSVGMMPAPLDQYNLYNVSAQPGQLQVRMNGGQVYSGGNTVGWTPSPRLGSSFYGTDCWSGDMAEVIVYDHVLTATERATVNNYLANKYGLTAPAPAPASLSAIGVAPTQVSVQWTDAHSSPGAIYLLERQVGAGSWAEVARISDAWSYFDQGLTAGTAYSYRVRGESLGGTVSGYSNTATVTTAATGVALPTTGQKLWLRADAGVSFDAGISAWLDQSDNHYQATQLWASAQPARVLNALNGHPVVRFSADSYQSLGLPDVMNGATAGEIFAVVRSAETAPIAYRTLWSFGSNPSGTMYPNFGGIVYESFGSTDWNDVGMMPAPLDQYNLYNVSAQPGQLQVRMNSGQVYTGSNTVGWTPSPRLGSSFYGTDCWSGDMAEVIVYDHVLTEAERTAVNNYLANKYGLTAPTPAPAGLTAIGVSPTQVSVQWTEVHSSPGEIYLLERKVGAGSWSEVAQVTDAWSYFDQGLTPGTAYSYRVRGQSLGGTLSGYSNTATVTTATTGAALPTTGQRLWLRADAGISFNAGISTWRDQSDNHYQATQLWAAAQPARVLNALNGHPVVRFSADSYQSLGLPDVMSGAGAGEIFAVVRSAETAPTAYRTLWSFGSNQNGTMYPNFGGIVYESFGSTDWNDVGMMPAPLDQYNLYNVAAQPGQLQVRMNGGQVYTGGNTVGWTPSPRLGSSFYGTDCWSGDMAEVIVYDHVLTEAERTAVNNYLAAKYGLTAPTPALANVSAIGVSPTQVSVQWTDAQHSPGAIYLLERQVGAGSWAEVARLTDTWSYFDQGLTAGTSYSYRVRGQGLGGTVSGYSDPVTVTTGTTGAALPTTGQKLWMRADAGISNDGGISAWLDQSDNHYQATQLWSTSQPVRVMNAVNGHPVVRFSADSYQSLGLPDVMNGATAGEIFAVVRSAETAPIAYRTLWSFGSNPSGTMYPNFGGIVYESFGSTDWNDVGMMPAPLDQYNLYNVSAQPGQLQVRMNGGQVYTGGNTVGWTPSPRLGSSFYGTDCWSGDLAEVIVYDHVLTEAERSAVNNYLAAKYGLTAPTPP